MYKKIGTICLIAGMVLMGCGNKAQTTANSTEAENTDGNVRESLFFFKVRIR